MFSCIILCCIISCYERLTSFYEVSRRCAFARVSDKTFCCWFWQNIYCLRFISSFMYMVEGNGLIYTTIQWCVTFYLKYKIHKMTRCPLSQFSLKSVNCDTTWSSWLIYHMYNVSPITPSSRWRGTFSLCSALIAFERGGFFIVPLWHGAPSFVVLS